MEPVTTTIITAAITAGVSAGVGDVYQGLRATLKRKFGGDSGVARAIDEVEKKPDSAELREALEKELDAAGASQDHEVR